MSLTASILPDYEGRFAEYHTVTVDGPESVAVVGCTKTKRDPGDGNTLPAERLYSKSDYFEKAWSYADLIADHRYILSAEHALVHPEDELEYYETYLGDLDSEGLAHLKTEVRWQLGGSVGGEIPVGAELVVLGGKQYVNLVEHVLDVTDFGGWVTLKTPLQDNVTGGIGAQKSWLKDQIDRRTAGRQATLGEVTAK